MSALTASVALCTYNGARFLPQQLDSLLSQQGRRLDEIVIRDDASADGSLALLEAFAERARALGIRVDLQRNAENLGYTRNFESALQAARGDVLFLCDQDDVWHADKLATMLAEFERRPGLLLLHSDARLVDADGAPLDRTLFDAIRLTSAERALIRAGREFDVLLRRNVVTGAAAAVRREVVQAAAPFAPGWVHDEWIALMAALCGEVDCIEAPLIDYRQHPGNAIGVPVAGIERERLVRREFLARVHRRLAELAARVGAAPGAFDADKVARLKARLQHAALRASLPANPLQRGAAVLREALSGRYSSCSTGLRSIVADLLALP